MKYALALILFLSASSCATISDCSVYKPTSPKRCKCIRDNGEIERAKKCSIVANEKYRERMRKRCYRTCFSAYDCDKCGEI